MQPHRHVVLVVDDEPDVLDALSTSLALGDVVAHAVSSGEEALELLAGGLLPCAIFLDVRMPRLDGWRVRERLRALPAADDVPVVLVSAEMPDRARADAAGIFRWLQKPVGIAQLDAVLRACCPGTVGSH
jgi:CheY-like chemotaxis protein